MPSVLLLEGLLGVVLISLSGVTASSEPLQVGVCGTPRLVDCRVARGWLRHWVILVRVHRYGRLSELIDMSPPNCIGCDSDFVGQGSRVGCDDSGHPLVSSTIVSGNNSLTYIQFAGRAVT